MRVLVTGGAGFIGSHVVTALASAGHDVRILDLAADAVDGGHDRLTGDVRDEATVARALAGVQAVVHLAGLVGLEADLGTDLPAYAGHNDLGTAVLLGGMIRQRVPRLVLASSMVVYGEGRYRCPTHGEGRPLPRAEEDLAAGRFEPRCERCMTPVEYVPATEQDPLDPRSAYAATKVAQEHLASVWARESGNSAFALRYHNVYGPGMPRNTSYAGVASIMCSALRRGEPAQVFEDGGQRRDFVHVRDVAAATAVAVDATGTATGLHAYNVASGEPHTIGELATELTRALDGPTPVVTGEYRLGDVRHLVATPERAERELRFRARVPFAAGIADLASELSEPSAR
ncbi:MAG: NAD-dependent epimerase/dehydratase family protein [Streptosporangiales bacterium]